jgi:F5/8 type C domain
VHNDREGTFSGDGEFDLSAYVQGKRVDLTGATSGYICSGGPLTGQYKCDGLMDVHEGQILKFNPGTEVTVEVPVGGTFLIATSGWEIDDERGTWRADDDPLVLKSVDALNDPKVVNKDPAISNFANWMYILADPGSIQANRNDRLGYLVTPYDLTTEFGKGSHEEKAYAPDYTLRYTISVSKLASLPPLAPQPLERVCNNNLPITSVTASGDDGNEPQNVLDNDLDTRWSSNGIGQFITVGLGSTKNICSVDITWYRGNERVYTYTISTSTDGITFTDVLKRQQSNGTTLNSEKYTIPATDARYVRVTVYGNTVNNFASITELDLFG